MTAPVDCLRRASSASASINRIRVLNSRRRRLNMAARQRQGASKHRAARQGRPERPPCDDLPLRPAGRVRRAPHDDAAARRPRSAACRVGAPDRAAADAPSLALRRFRQLRGARLLFRRLDRAHDREPLHGRTDGGRFSRRRDRSARALLSVFLSARRAARHLPLDRAPVRGSGRRPRPLGASVRDSRGNDADEPSPDDADLCDQGRVFLRAARGIGRAAAAP